MYTINVNSFWQGEITGSITNKKFKKFQGPLRDFKDFTGMRLLPTNLSASKDFQGRC